MCKLYNSKNTAFEKVIRTVGPTVINIDVNFCNDRKENTKKIKENHKSIMYITLIG